MLMKHAAITTVTLAWNGLIPSNVHRIPPAEMARVKKMELPAMMHAILANTSVTQTTAELRNVPRMKTAAGIGLKTKTAVTQAHAMRAHANSHAIIRVLQLIRKNATHTVMDIASVQKTQTAV